MTLSFEKFIDIVRSGDIVEIKAALEETDPSAENNEAIKVAAEVGFEDVVKILLEDSRVDPAASENEALGRACEHGHTEVVKVLLLDSRVDPSDDGSFPLVISAEKDYTNIIHLLLDNGKVDVNVDDNALIKLAAKNGNVQVIKRLLSNEKIDPALENNIVIEYAASEGHLDVVKLLVQDNRVNPVGIGYSPIITAADNGHYEVVMFLAKHYSILPHINILRKENASIRSALKWQAQLEEGYFWFAYGCQKMNVPMSIVQFKIASYLVDMECGRDNIENACVLAHAFGCQFLRKAISKKPKTCDHRSFIKGIVVANQIASTDVKKETHNETQHQEPLTSACSDGYKRDYWLPKRILFEEIPIGSIVGGFDDGISLETHGANYLTVVSSNKRETSSISAVGSQNTHCLVVYAGDVLVRLSRIQDKEVRLAIPCSEANAITVIPSGDNDGTGKLQLGRSYGSMQSWFVVPDHDIVETEKGNFIKIRIRSNRVLPSIKEIESEVKSGLEPPLYLRVDFSPYTVPMQKFSDYQEGTRGWILREIEKWFLEEKTNVFVFMGHAGVGKSTVCSLLCQHLWSNKSYHYINIQAVHFFKHDDQRLSSSRNCIMSISSQLCKCVPGFRHALHSRVGDLSQNALDQYDVSTLYSMLILEPGLAIQKAQLLKKRVVVVIDALDECEMTHRRVLLNIIQMKWKVPWLCLIVSTRPEDYIPVKLKGFRATELNASCDENLQDLKMFIENFVKKKLKRVSNYESTSDVLVTQIVKILLKRSQGLFLYIRYLDDMIDFNSENTLEEIKDEDNVPVGIEGVYEEYFRRLKDVLGDENYSTFLSPLVASRTPLSGNTLFKICNFENFRLFKRLLKKANNLLYIEGRIRFIHKSMVEWLTNEETTEDLFVDLLEGHQLISKFCEIVSAEIWKAPYIDVSAYGHRSHPLQEHTIFHLCQASQGTIARRLLMSFSWLHSYVSMFDPLSLVHDVKQYYLSEYQNDVDVRKVIGAVEKCAQTLKNDPNELTSQLLGRIKVREEEKMRDSDSVGTLDKLLADAESFMSNKLWIRPLSCKLTPSLTSHQRVIQGRQRRINQVVFSSDSKLVATAGDMFVIVWLASSWESIHELKGHFDDVIVVDFSSISRKELASGSKDKTVRIWDLVSGECKKVLGDYDVSCLKYSPDGSFLCASCLDGTVIAWTTENSYYSHVMFKNNTYTSFLCCCFGIDDSSIFVGGSDNNLHVWRPKMDATVEELLLLSGHTRRVQSLLRLPSGKFVVSGSFDRSVRMWDTKTFECILSKYVDVHVKSIGCTPDGNFLYTVGYQYIKCWKSCNLDCVDVIASHTEGSTSVCVSGKKDTYVVTSDLSGDILLYNEISKSYKNPPSDIALGRIDLMSRESWKFLKLNLGQNHLEKIRSVAIHTTPEKVVAVTAADDGNIRFWSITTKKSNLTSVDIDFLRGHVVPKGSDQFPLFNDMDSCRSFCAFAGQDGMIYIFQIIAKKFIFYRKLEAHREHLKVTDYSIMGSYNSYVKNVASNVLECLTVKFSSNGNLLASGGSDCNVNISTFIQAKDKKILRGHTDNVTSVDFSHDDRFLVSGSRDMTVRVWDTCDYTCKTTLAGHKQQVNSVSFSSESEIVASAGNDKCVRIWSWTRGVCMRVIDTQRVESVEFSPTNRDLLASGDDDGIIHVWDISTGGWVERFSGHDSKITDIAFSSDGKRIVSSSSDETVRVWNCGQPSIEGIEGWKDPLVLNCQSGEVRGVVLFRDITCISAGSDHTLSVWDLNKARPTATRHRGYVPMTNSINISSDGSMLAAAIDGATCIYDTSTKKRIGKVRGHSWIICAVQFSHDDTLLATGGMDHNVCIWRLEGVIKSETDGSTPLEQMRLESDNGGILSISFSQDNKLLVVTTLERKLSVWNIDSMSHIFCVSTSHRISRLGISAMNHKCGVLELNLICQEMEGRVFIYSINHECEILHEKEETLTKAGFVRFRKNFVPSLRSKSGAGFTCDAAIWNAVVAVVNNTAYYAVASNNVLHLLIEENLAHRSSLKTV